MEPRGGRCVFQCVCKERYTKVMPFLKILDLADIGLKIYRYLATKYAQVTDVAPESPGAGTDVFILHNTRNQDLPSLSFIQELDVNKINCPRCKQVAKHAKRLIETIPTVNKGNIVGVCDHCRKRAEPRCSCEVCDKIVKKFISSGDKRKQETPSSQPNLSLRNIKRSPENPNILNKPQWDDSFLDMRKQFEEKLIPYFSKPRQKIAVHDQIRKHFQDASLIRSRSETFLGGFSELTEEILDKAFQYYFPKGLSEKQVIKDTEEKYRLLAEARKPQVFFDKYGQPIPAERILNVNYDIFGQPIERMQDIYYDKNGQPIPQEVYYDKNGKPIPGRWVPEVHYDKYGRPLQSGKMTEVYYDKYGQLIGRQAPVLYYDERGQPVYRTGQPTGKQEPETYYNERGQPVYRTGQPTGRQEPEIYYNERGQPVYRTGQPTGRQEPETYYNERGQPVYRTGQPTGRQEPETYNERGQPVYRPGPSTGKQVPKVYDHEREQPVQVGRSEGISNKGYKSSTIPSFGTDGFESDYKSKRSTIKKDKRSATKLDSKKEKEAKVRSLSKLHSNKEKKYDNRDSTKLHSKKEKYTNIRDSTKLDSKKEKDSKIRASAKLDNKQKMQNKFNKNKKPEETWSENKTKREARRREKDLEIGNNSEKKSTDNKAKQGLKKDEENKENIEQLKTTVNKDDGVFQKKLQEAKKLRNQEKEEKAQKEKEKWKQEKADKQNIKKSLNEQNFLSKVLTQQDKAKLAEEKRKKEHDEELKKIKESINKKNNTTTFKTVQTGDNEISEKEKQHKLFKIDEKLVSKSSKHRKEDKPTKEINFNFVNIQKSQDQFLSSVVKVKPMPKNVKVTEKELEILSKIYKLHPYENHIEGQCDICGHSDLQIQLDNFMYKKYAQRHRAKQDIIIGQKVKTFKNLSRVNLLQDEERPVDNDAILPIMFKTIFTTDSNAEVIENIPMEPSTPPVNERRKSKTSTGNEEAKKGFMRYALSDRSFIDKGWTMLPTEKVVRKMNVYRMRPARPEFDWFERNKNKRYMEYDSGDKLAEFTDDGHGRWFYRNGKVALDYYNAEESHAKERFVIFSSGERDDRGRTHPYTVLASFDYLGNGIVFDHGGKIRLKYNQTEGVVLDRSLGPVSHWKWHTLNDPPELQKVMIDTQLCYKDPEILNMEHDDDDKNNQPKHDDMLAIEFDNFLKAKNKKLTQKFKPFQIKMKALKINEHFSLRILDQSSIYLIFRDGSTNLKLNMGMLLDHKEIVDTDTADMGDVANSIEKFPASTDSIAAIQANIDKAHQEARLRLERERRLCPPVARASVDQLRAAASRPPPRHVHPAPSDSTSEAGQPCVYKKKSFNNLYHANSII